MDELDKELTLFIQEYFQKWAGPPTPADWQRMAKTFIRQKAWGAGQVAIAVEKERTIFARVQQGYDRGRVDGFTQCIIAVQQIAFAETEEPRKGVLTTLVNELKGVKNADPSLG